MSRTTQEKWQAYYAFATEMCQGCPQPCDSLKPWVCTRASEWETEQAYQDYWAPALEQSAD